MKTKRFLLAAGFALAMVFTISCSGGGGGGSKDDDDIIGGDNLVKKEKISGFSQKGPFVRGSSITLYELDNNLVQTGKSFESTIADDKGSFEINGISLVSPYVRLKTNGYYYNEVSGKKSASPITLYAIADLTNKNSLNVNLLTHLEHEKVQALVESGKSVKEAKKQAQKDILKIFGISGDFADSEDMSIFGSSEGSAALLAISILFQGERDEASFTDLLADFNQAIKNSSEWSTAKKTEMADWISGMNLESIRTNINNWGLPFEVPIFEKHVRKFWSDVYGLSDCNPAGNGHITINANPLSINKDRNYVCNGSYWESTENPSSSSSAGSCSELQYENETCGAELYPYCYGYLNYKDCNLIGGRWILDEEYCFSGNGILVNSAYCNKNGITIDDSPRDNPPIQCEEEMNATPSSPNSTQTQCNQIYSSSSSGWNYLP